MAVNSFWLDGPERSATRFYPQGSGEPWESPEPGVRYLRVAGEVGRGHSPGPGGGRPDGGCGWRKQQPLRPLDASAVGSSPRGQAPTDRAAVTVGAVSPCS